MREHGTRWVDQVDDVREVAEGADAYPALPLCPSRGDLVMVALRSGRSVPARCGSLACSVCIVIEARNFAAAISLAAPQRAIMLTEVGDEWPTIQRRVNRLREYLQRRRIAGQWAWHVEVNPSGRGHHVHAWQWGAHPITKDVLSELAQRAGLGREVGIGSVEAEVGLRGTDLPGAGAMAYGMKTVLQVPEGAGLSASQTAYLKINGGRLGHASHGFWRDAAGRRLAGRKEAVRVALRSRQPDPHERWSPMTRAAADRVLGLHPHRPRS